MAGEKEWRLVVPTVDNAGNPIRTEVLEAIATAMAEHFGGVTVYPAAGCWEEQHTLHCDPNIVLAAAEVEGQPSAGDAANEAFMADLARRVGEELGQGAVFEQETTTDYTQWQPGHYQATLPGSMLDLRLPRIPQQAVFDTILPGRLGRRA